MQLQNAKQAIHAAIAETDKLQKSVLRDLSITALKLALSELAKLEAREIAGSKGLSDMDVMRAAVMPFIKTVGGKRELDGLLYSGDIPPRAIARYYEKLQGVTPIASAKEVAQKEEKKQPTEVVPSVPHLLDKQEQEAIVGTSEEELDAKIEKAIATIAKAETGAALANNRSIPNEIVKILAATYGIAPSTKRADILAEIWANLQSESED